MPEIKIESAYTQRANPRRGYHDWRKVVTFIDHDEEFQVKYMQSVRQDLVPGNMWVTEPTKIEPNIWAIFYGYDSGD